MKNSVAKVQNLIEPTVEALDLELWGIEHAAQGKYSVLRIYIESDAGITIDDCEKVSRQVSAIFDVEDPIAGEYTLEVSSPGLDRPLFTLEQFGQFAGTEVNVRMRGPIEGRRKFKGVVAGVAEDSVSMKVDDEIVVLPFADIEKANVVY
ncbi:MAG: ribosome maturation factor RimP [Pseudomonadales bacterium]|nr:ribosome maturation factor RimP [Pseudomonadales bacterium]